MLLLDLLPLFVEEDPDSGGAPGAYILGGTYLPHPPKKKKKKTKTEVPAWFQVQVVAPRIERIRAEMQRTRAAEDELLLADLL